MNKKHLWFLPVGLLLWCGARYNNLLFHALAGFWSIGISLLIGYVGISTFRYTRNLFVVGIGFLSLAVGAVDLLHTLVYEGMGVFPSTTADQSIQLWIIARWLQSLGFFPVLFLHRQERALVLSGSLLFGMTSAGILCIFSGLFPTCYVSGSGLTPFGLWNECGVSIAFVIAALCVWCSTDSCVKPYRNVFMAALLFSLSGEIAFILYLEIYGVVNVVGYLFQCIGGWVLFEGFLLSSVRDPLFTLFAPRFADREAFLGAMTGPSGILDGNGKVLASNAHLQHHVPQIGRQTLCPLADLLAEAEGVVLKELDEAVRTRAPQHFEFLWKGKEFRAGIYPIPSKGTGPERQYVFISWDVTCEKKVRTELAETRESLLEAQEMALLGTMRVEMATGKVDCSKSFLSLFGLSPVADIDFRWYNSRILEEDRKTVDAIRQTAWHSGKDAYRFECRILRLDGAVRNIRVWVRTARDEAGEVTELVGSFQDVTDQVRLREELEASEALYRSYIEKAPVGVFVVDERGCFVKTNRAASVITGFSREELLGLSLHDCFSPERRNRVLQKFQRMRTRGTIWLQVPFLRNDGTEGFCEIQAVTLPDGTHMALVQDLTMKREALESARMSQERYEFIFDTIMEGFGIHEAILDSGGDLVDYRFLEVNPAFEKLTGLSVQRVLGRTAREVLPHLEGCWFQAYREVVRTGESVMFREFAEELGCWYEVLAFPIGEKQFGTIFRDVSREQRHEEELEKMNRELEEHVGELERAWEQTINVLADITEFRDPYTSGHQRRVAEITKAICLEMGLDETVTLETVRAAFVHDIGKIQIPSDFLSKPGRLSEKEFRIIRKHPRVGADLLKGIDLPWPLGDIVDQHHERMDGSGYPEGLEGDEILLQARIIAVADVVEAMASDRPYRPSLGIDAALEEVERWAGVKYDAAVVTACMRLFNEKGFELPE